MFELKKCGKNQYGVWVLGTLRVKGYEITDIFNTNLKEEPTEDFTIKKIIVKRTKNGNLRFSIEI